MPQMNISTADEKLVEASRDKYQHNETTQTVSTKAIHEKDLDKAYLYLARQNQNHVGDDVNLKAVRRKVDWWILPLISLFYGFQFLDKIIINVSPVRWP